MGAYINPLSMEKEDWLNANAKGTGITKWSQIPDGKSFLVWMDNGHFTALGICFDENEFNEFMEMAKRDDRPKLYYLADTDKVYGVSDLENYLPRKESE